MFYVYILENTKGRFYIGHTVDLERRLREHNDPDGKAHLGKYAHKHGPWRRVWSEPHTTRSSAMSRERELKAWKSSARIRRELLSGSVPSDQDYSFGPWGTCLVQRVSKPEQPSRNT